MGSPRFHAILAELAALHDEKDAAYSGNTPLSNYRTAEEWGDPAWKSSLLRAEEKRKRLQNQWKSGQPLTTNDWYDWICHLVNTVVLWQEDGIPFAASCVEGCFCQCDEDGCKCNGLKHE